MSANPVCATPDGTALLPLSKIRTDGGTQPRMVMDYDAIEGYMDDMLVGVKFPPVIVFYDGTDYWLADGFHRREAAFGVERKEIDADVRQGTLEDAQWFSFSANRTNGLRRSNEDKQRAVKAALLHPNGAGKSDGSIAQHLGVDPKTVSAWREKLTMEIPESTVRTGSDGRKINTSNIGKSKSRAAKGTPPVSAQKSVGKNSYYAIPAADVEVALPAAPILNYPYRTDNPTASAAATTVLVDHDDKTDYGRPVHPMCELFPPVEGNDFFNLSRDIETNGLLYPIVVHEGQIVDGKARLLACQDTGTEPRFIEWGSIYKGPVSLSRWIWSVNREHRHLTIEQQVDMDSAMNTRDERETSQ
jgi:hypothetical protein